MFVQLTKVTKELFVPDNPELVGLFEIMNDGNAQSEISEWVPALLFLFIALPLVSGSVMMDVQY